MYYDRDGLPISDDEWVRLLKDEHYRRVARTKLLDASDPAKCYDVSTVWIGLDHAFGNGPPLIFETMVWPSGDDAEVECTRYPTEQQAMDGHTRTVVMVTVDLADPVIMEAAEQAQG